jgi:chromosome partitioning protein
MAMVDLHDRCDRSQRFMRIKTKPPSAGPLKPCPIGQYVAAWQRKTLNRNSSTVEFVKPEKGEFQLAAEIIAVTQQKGGVGKSTIAMHLGAAFHEKGKRVLVVDADGQNTLVHWASASTDGDTGIPFPVVNLAEAGGQIHREIKKFIGDYDIIVVDCPPSITENVSGVVLLAASAADYWSSVGLVKLIQQAQVMNEDLRAVFLLNKTEEKRMLTRELKRALEELGFPLLRTQIPTREAYKQAMALGQTVLQMNDRGAKLASQEVRACADEIAAMLP